MPQIMEPYAGDPGTLARLVSVIAGVLGLTVGYLGGLRSNGAFRDLSDVYVGTAGHTKTYVLIAQLLRKGNQQEAVKLAELMIDVGTSSLIPVPRELDAEDKAHLANVPSAVRQYRAAVRPTSPSQPINDGFLSENGRGNLTRTANSFTQKADSGRSVAVSAEFPR